MRVLLWMALVCPTFAQSVEPLPTTDVPYRTDETLDGYAEERCLLDVCLPPDAGPEPEPRFSTVVWFHGGGLTSGSKKLPEGLIAPGVCVVTPNYRLHPRVSSPTYVEDAAGAVAWTFKNIERYGGDADRIFVAGHSAGGYLTSMVGLDKTYLAAHGVDADRIAGLIPYSGHTITHFTVRKERGIDGKQPVLDEMAPLFHVRKDAPPILLVTGDRNLELLGRYEENAYFWRMLRVVGHPDATLFELGGFDHGGMGPAAHPLLLKFVERVSNGE